MNLLEQIKDFIQKQRALLHAVRDFANGELDELRLREQLPPNVTTLGELWEVSPHGRGIRFRGHKSDCIVDAHVGINDGDDIFDPWRLFVYLNSRKEKVHSEHIVKHAIQTLANSGQIESSLLYPNHFTLARLSGSETETRFV